MSVKIATHRESNVLFAVFCLWSFITLCRPQDCLDFLALLRPSFTIGIIMLLFYLAKVPGRKSIIKIQQFKLFMCLIMIIILGVPFSYYRSAALFDAFDYISVSLLFFLLFYEVADSIEKLKSLIFAYCCGASIYAVYILIFGKLTSERIFFGAMFDPNDIAFFLINFFAFNLMFIKNENTLIKRLIANGNLLICLIVLFKTGSRGGFMACTAMFAYLLFVKTKTIRISIFIKAVICMIVFILLFSFNTNTDRYKTILDVQDDYNVTDETGRVAIWKIGMRLMFSNPLTGVGIGRFNEGVGKDREERGLLSTKWQAAHNSFVQIGAETGIIGFVLFIWISYRVFGITKRIVSKSESEDLVMISEMTRVGFLGHFICALFLSQAYSIYWVFYIVLSAQLNRIYELEQVKNGIKNKDSLCSNADNFRGSREGRSEFFAISEPRKT